MGKRLSTFVARFDRVGFKGTKEEPLYLDDLDTIRIRYGPHDDQYFEISPAGGQGVVRIQNYSATEQMVVRAAGSETVDLLYYPRKLSHLANRGPQKPGRVGTS